jgi:predicted metal-dependent phosphoesterase TrpH
LLKADLHVHTRYSVDSDTSFDQIIEICQKTGINCVAITDHGTTLGAREFSKIAPFKVIICEEILTPYGEIMGVFLKEDIPEKSTVEETLSQIKAQGGLVCIPHPYDKIRPTAFRDENKLKDIIDQVDIIEVYNARSRYPGIEAKAHNLASIYKKCMSGGSDAHNAAEIGRVYVEIEEFTTSQEYLNVLSKGKFHKGKSNPFVHVLSSASRLKKYISR